MNSELTLIDTVNQGGRIQYYEDRLCRRHGLAVAWYKNDQMRYRCNYKEGRLHGLYEEWHANGQLWERCYYKEGLLHGEYLLYHENGIIARMCYYTNMAYQNTKTIQEPPHEIPHGELKRWNSSGRLVSHMFFVYGENITEQVEALIVDKNNITDEEELLIKIKFGIDLL